jgi:hypothetical protein
MKNPTKNPTAQAIEPATTTTAEVHTLTIDKKVIEVACSKAVFSSIRAFLKLDAQLEARLVTLAESFIPEVWPASYLVGTGQNAVTFKKTLMDAKRDDGIPFYSVAVQLMIEAHPDSVNAAKKREAQAAAKDAKDERAADEAKFLAEKYETEARTRSHARMRAMLDHFVKAHHDATIAGESREDITARQLIEATITEWNERLNSSRGLAKIEAERMLLNSAVFALRDVLGGSYKAKSSIFSLPGTQHTLSDEAPVGSPEAQPAMM